MLVPYLSYCSYSSAFKDLEWSLDLGPHSAVRLKVGFRRTSSEDLTVILHGLRLGQFLCRVTVYPFLGLKRP